MKRIGMLLALVSVLAVPAHAQQAQREAEIKALVPFTDFLKISPGSTYTDYERVVRDVAREELGKERTTPTRPSFVPPVAAYPPPLPPYVPPSYAPRTYVPAAPSYVPPAPTFGTTYDWTSGNRYSWQKNFDGSTSVRGSNLNTGSIWRTTIEPDGSMKGYDKDFNYWKYNATTGTYMNFGTGTICTGQGAFRICS